jgi:hypothetical protein
VAQGVTAHIYEQAEQEPEVDKALRAADIIIDATAPLVAARALSDHPAKARRLSTFFNPSGESAIQRCATLKRSIWAWSCKRPALPAHPCDAQCASSGRNRRYPLRLVDIPAKRIHLVDATPAPPGSVEEAGRGHHDRPQQTITPPRCATERQTRAQL